MWSKILGLLMLPPAGPWLLALAGALGCHRRWGRLLLFFSLAAWYLLAIEPVRDLLSRPLEYADPVLDLAALPGEAEAVVVLGAGLREKAPAFHGENIPSSDALWRLWLAADIAKRTGLPLYVSGGMPPTSSRLESEAAVMRRWAIRLGVDARRIRQEASSRNTLENARKISEALGQQGIRRIVLVTNAWHMPRARWCFERQALVVIAAPVGFVSRQTPYQATSFLPDADVLADSAHMLHEYLGMLWYRLKARWSA